MKRNVRTRGKRANNAMNIDNVTLRRAGGRNARDNKQTAPRRKSRFVEVANRQGERCEIPADVFQFWADKTRVEEEDILVQDLLTAQTQRHHANTTPRDTIPQQTTGQSFVIPSMHPFPGMNNHAVNIPIGALPRHTVNQNSQPPAPRNTTTCPLSTPRDLTKIVTAWKLKFSGKRTENLGEFLTRVEECRQVAALSDEELIRAIPMLSPAPR